jgi:hypothetical protein
MISSSNNSAKSQRSRLLERLRITPLTTFQAQHEQDIPSAAPRIFELRHNYGYNIKTEYTYVNRPGNSGRHRIANYVLLSGKYQEKK